MDHVAAAGNGAKAAREPGPLRLGRGEFPPDLAPARTVRGLE